jgi:DNA polymerase V
MNKKSKAGGVRSGSGRPKGSGKYGELTQPIRVPVSLLSDIEALICRKTRQETNPLRFDNVYPYPIASEVPPPSIPLYSTRVAAGFPSPADDHVERHLDLNQHLVQRPSATFFVRVEGESMINAGIHENDILIVDRSIGPTNGKIVIAVVNGELTVKRLKITDGHVWLMPENPRYVPIKITEEIDFRIWGVVVHVIHSL